MFLVKMTVDNDEATPKEEIYNDLIMMQKQTYPESLSRTTQLGPNWPILLHLLPGLCLGSAATWSSLRLHHQYIIVQYYNMLYITSPTHIMWQLLYFPSYCDCVPTDIYIWWSKPGSLYSSHKPSTIDISISKDGLASTASQQWPNRMNFCSYCITCQRAVPVNEFT